MERETSGEKNSVETNNLDPHSDQEQVQHVIHIFRKAVDDDSTRLIDVLIHLGFDNQALDVFTELGFDIHTFLHKTPFYVLENLALETYKLNLISQRTFKNDSTGQPV